jgi:hypothetical protein
MEWQPIATVLFGLAVNRIRPAVGPVLLLFVLLLPRPGYSQVFDGLSITEQERHWFAEIRACCGLGDAFVADSFYEKAGKFYAVITDGTDWFYRIKGAIRSGPQSKYRPTCWRRLTTRTTLTTPIPRIMVSCSYRFITTAVGS